MYLPNIRSNFIPDPGFMVFDIDLDRADAQVVAWDSGCENLKRAFRKGVDTHLLNAKLVYGLDFTEDDIIEGTETHKEIKKAYSGYRDTSKAGGHATNYLASPHTLAGTLGISEKEATGFQEAYFDANPEILNWHNEIEHNIQTTRTIKNAFGFHITYFDRPSSIITEAVAWIPQSTVGIITNKMWDNLETNLSYQGVQVFFQVHDSLVGQFPKRLYPEILPEIHKQSLIEMPYDDPRAIPTGIKVSEKSWGEAVDVAWGDEE